MKLTESAPCPLSWNPTWAISLLAEPKVRRAIDVVRADSATQDRYGRNVFGWSLLMARNLIEAGVNLVQMHFDGVECWVAGGAC